MVDHDELFGRLAEISNRQAWDRLSEVLTDDYVEEYPQSGEVIRGLANARAVRAEYPGIFPEENFDRASVRLAAGDEKWVMTPMFTVVNVQGSGNVGTAMFRVHYPDHSTWWVVMVYELDAGKMCRSTAFFAPLFDPPEWRAAYRESP
jgi:hypothetical protein